VKMGPGGIAPWLLGDAPGQHLYDDSCCASDASTVLKICLSYTVYATDDARVY